MDYYDVIVIGAGPSGLISASSAAAQGASVLVLEKNRVPGRKLLLTGGGKCNITHSGGPDEFLRHYGSNSRFAGPSLYAFSNLDLASFFHARGLELEERDEGRIFPATSRARDVLDVLVHECRSAGIEIRYGARALGIVRAPDGFAVRAGRGETKARSVIIATGGRSYPGTGSTGDGYELASSLGHSISPPSPALVPITVRDYHFAPCAGVSLRGTQIILRRAGGKPIRAAGDVLFTASGLSGPGILDLSRYVRSGDTISVSLAPFGSAAFAERALAEAAGRSGKKILRSIAASFGVPARLAGLALEASGISPDIRGSALDRRTRTKAAHALASFTMEVEERGGFEDAMATAGGVVLAEVRPGSLESRLVPRLFFAGELLDIDGDTGGYNLQFAFSSGWLAGRGAAAGSRSMGEGG